MDLIYLYILWNLAAFLIMGVDKHNSMHHRQRIKENALVGIAVFMGAVGCIAGSIVFKHKTKKAKFKIAFPLAFAFNMILVFTYIQNGIKS